MSVYPSWFASKFASFSVITAKFSNFYEFYRSVVGIKGFAFWYFHANFWDLHSFSAVFGFICWRNVPTRWMLSYRVPVYPFLNPVMQSSVESCEIPNGMSVVLSSSTPFHSLTLTAVSSLEKSVDLFVISSSDVRHLSMSSICIVVTFS